MTPLPLKKVKSKKATLCVALTLRCSYCSCIELQNWNKMHKKSLYGSGRLENQYLVWALLVNTIWTQSGRFLVFSLSSLQQYFSRLFFRTFRSSSLDVGYLLFSSLWRWSPTALIMLILGSKEDLLWLIFPAVLSIPVYPPWARFLSKHPSMETISDEATWPFFKFSMPSAHNVEIWQVLA